MQHKKLDHRVQNPLRLLQPWATYLSNLNNGGVMKKDHIKLPNDEDAKSLMPVIDYSPKVYSIGKQILCVIKMLAIGG